MERVLKGESKHSQEFLKLDEKFWTEPDPETGETHPEPTQIVAGKQTSEGSTDIRRDAPAKRKAKNDGDIRPVDVNKSKQKGLDMVNKGTGIPAPPRNRQERPKPVRPPEETNAMQMVLIKGLGDHGQSHNDEPAVEVGADRQPGCQGPEHPRDQRQRGRVPPRERRPAPDPEQALHAWIT